MNYKENGHVKGHCPMLIPDKGQKEMNMIEDFEGDTLIFLVKKSIESWVLDSCASFHTSHSNDVMQNFSHYIGKV